MMGKLKAVSNFMPGLNCINEQIHLGKYVTVEVILNIKILNHNNIL